jgi:hypothetical protein
MYTVTTPGPVGGGYVDRGAEIVNAATAPWLARQKEQRDLQRTMMLAAAQNKMIRPVMPEGEFDLSQMGNKWETNPAYLQGGDSLYPLPLPGGGTASMKASDWASIMGGYKNLDEYQQNAAIRDREREAIANQTAAYDPMNTENAWKTGIVAKEKPKGGSVFGKGVAKPTPKLSDDSYTDAGRAKAGLPPLKGSEAMDWLTSDPKGPKVRTATEAVDFLVSKGMTPQGAKKQVLTWLSE